MPGTLAFFFALSYKYMIIYDNGDDSGNQLTHHGLINTWISRGISRVVSISFHYLSYWLAVVCEFISTTIIMQYDTGTYLLAMAYVSIRFPAIYRLWRVSVRFAIYRRGQTTFYFYFCRTGDRSPERSRHRSAVLLGAAAGAPGWPGRRHSAGGVPSLGGACGYFLLLLLFSHFVRTIFNFVRFSILI